MANNNYSKVYTSFSGSDILVSVDGNAFGELQGISFSVTREKAPLYTLGSADPRSFSRGKRGISGSLIFLVFNRSPLPGKFDKLNPPGRFIARPGEAAAFLPAAELATLPTETVSDIGGLDTYYKSEKVWYADQLPPFDALVKAVNEYGHSAQMEILGIEILNTGSGMSVDDITIDESHTYVARRIKKWYAQARFSWAGKTGSWSDVSTNYAGVEY